MLRRNLHGMTNQCNKSTWSHFVTKKTPAHARRTSDRHPCHFAKSPINAHKCACAFDTKYGQIEMVEHGAWVCLVRVQ